MAVLIILIFKFEPSEKRKTTIAKQKEFGCELGRVDYLGSTLLSTSIVCGVLLLRQGGQGFQWLSWAPWLLFLLTASTFTGFVWTELHVAREPIFPFRILRKPNVLVSYLVSFLQIFAQTCLMFSVPLYFQVTSQASATTAGAHLVPAVVGNALGGLLAGWVINNTGRFKPLTQISGLVASLGYVLLMLFWNGSTNRWEAWYIFPSGFGTGMLQAAIFVSMAAGLDASDIGVATGGFFLFMSIGMVSSVTIANSILVSRFREGLEQRIHGPNKSEIITKALSDTEYINNLPGELRRVVIECYISGLRNTHYISLFASLASWVLAFKLEDTQL
ncbi:hypothetical protein AK830_g3345 [Neonectria ditissima]|uniref:Major facilitator superfamily (MFS) profile domain-containing protein n=1 Tax=Neonectria ditissima TaxID=78410 RepID=A0A0P7BS74_9HYPO|nr:hypothetical protein AK830_g3345 [Neonectria ditissima]